MRINLCDKTCRHDVSRSQNKPPPKAVAHARISVYSHPSNTQRSNHMEEEARKKGRPFMFAGGKHRNVTLDDETWERARAYGLGNASAGIRRAFDELIKGKTA